MSSKTTWNGITLPEHIQKIVDEAPKVHFATKPEQLVELCCGSYDNKEWDVEYELPDGSTVNEAHVVRVKNGISANYPEPYMRRRDPNCMLIADDLETEKELYQDRFGVPFEGMRQRTFDWLSEQEIAVFAFEMGQPGIGGDAIAVCPANAAFFAFGLALLQGLVDVEKLGREFKPSTVIYVAPPFRHTDFDGKQVVVHNRIEEHEIFSYNLYPGPSAKKGVYGALIRQGSEQGWVTAHCSAVQVMTPYDNLVTFMHEGASGGGKSELLQQPHRLPDGRIMIGKNIATGEKQFIEIARTCDLHPLCDDMGLCHPDYQEGDGKLWLMDAEDAWFVRVDHITEYGTDHDLESLTVAPSEPLLFLNVDMAPGGTALIWEHIEDEPGVPCPNPRVVIPRKIVPDVVEGKMSVDIRSFGVRMPPCTAENPTYGIIGLLHILPPALAWLWRLVAPRGHANPSIVDTGGMSSEGVGSYWPFATGRKVDQANLLLRQIVDSPKTKYILMPNQHIGSWKTGFMPEWLARDYLARRGHARFHSDQLTPSRCSLLGYSLDSMRIEGRNIARCLLQVDQQPEVGKEAYDVGAEMLRKFFHEQVSGFLCKDLDKLGNEIIECCLDGGSVGDYKSILDFDDTAPR
ncbi:hypothetical protein STSP2_02870 [Anaerohalosphaera lusitana]|uniref:DUF4914 domain-containing protein n=1 Tax=Anaerohalosphaera lusitana TaxID=1936003 RepID=A0A1U9NPB0_9BACT|nr:DUF4914 family protein [Anaerohalosphaera lusitana]AQT69675.1 hypothetical protein STSP2_02870 [Anaerohalosphaera lusitana]